MAVGVAEGSRDVEHVGGDTPLGGGQAEEPCGHVGGGGDHHPLGKQRSVGLGRDVISGPVGTDCRHRVRDDGIGESVDE